MKGLAILAVAALAFACSAPADEEPDITKGQPACSEVWVAGETLPEDYDGCLEDDSLVVVIEGSDGTIGYDDRLQAKPGETIKEIK